MFPKQDRYVFTCDRDNCGKEAMSFIPEENSIIIYHQSGKSTHYFGDHREYRTYGRSKEVLAKIVRALENVDLKTVFSFLRDSKNWCHECDKVYCKKHWNAWPVFEEGGWYDCTEGICPKGHKVILSD